jgi:hypothetical protein
MRRGKDNGKCVFGVKLRGFIYYKGRKLDIFTLKDILKKDNKAKSLKINEFEEAVEFCKMARTSELSVRSLFKDQKAQDNLVHVTQLVFFVKNKKTGQKLKEGRLNFIKLNVNSENVEHKLLDDFSNYLTTALVQK